MRRLLALETVVVVWQFAFAFAAVWQAHFQEVVADHEGEVAGVVVQLQVFFVGGVAVEATGGVVFWFFAKFGGLDGVVAGAVQGQAGLQTVAVGAGQDAVVGAFEGIARGSGGRRGGLAIGRRGGWRRRVATQATGEEEGDEEAGGFEGFRH